MSSTSRNIIRAERPYDLLTFTVQLLGGSYWSWKMVDEYSGAPFTVVSMCASSEAVLQRCCRYVVGAQHVHTYEVLHTRNLSLTRAEGVTVGTCEPPSAPVGVSGGNGGTSGRRGLNLSDSGEGLDLQDLESRENTCRPSY